jgi:hypothetical protein
VREDVRVRAARFFQGVGQDREEVRGEGPSRREAGLISGLGQLRHHAVLPPEPTCVDADLAERQWAEEVAEQASLVVRRLLAAGYRCIRVGVQGHRLAAIKTYLQVGFVPFRHDAALHPRWQRICTQLGWPFTPDAWPRTVSGAAAENRRPGPGP